MEFLVVALIFIWLLVLVGGAKELIPNGKKGGNRDNITSFPEDEKHLKLTKEIEDSLKRNRHPGAK